MQTLYLNEIPGVVNMFLCAQNMYITIFTILPEWKPRSQLEICSFKKIFHPTTPFFSSLWANTNVELTPMTIRKSKWKSSKNEKHFRTKFYWCMAVFRFNAGILSLVRFKQNVAHLKRFKGMQCIFFFLTVLTDHITVRLRSHISVWNCRDSAYDSRIAAKPRVHLQCHFILMAPQTQCNSSTIVMSKIAQCMSPKTSLGTSLGGTRFAWFCLCDCSAICHATITAESHRYENASRFKSPMCEWCLKEESLKSHRSILICMYTSMSYLNAYGRMKGGSRGKYIFQSLLTI